MMIDKIQIVKQRFDEVSDLIIQPDIIMDQKRYVRLNKEYKDLKKIVDKGEVYQATLSNLKEANEIIADGSDPEMVEMARMQLEEANEKIKPENFYPITNTSPESLENCSVVSDATCKPLNLAI